MQSYRSDNDLLLFRYTVKHIEGDVLSAWLQIYFMRIQNAEINLVKRRPNLGKLQQTKLAFHKTIDIHIFD